MKCTYRVLNTWWIPFVCGGQHLPDHSGSDGAVVALYVWRRSQPSAVCVLEEIRFQKISRESARWAGVFVAQ